jgi:hypothetical protein
MRFITIETKYDGSIAINADNITSVQESTNSILIYLSGDTPITTRFTTIASAVDYIQRASTLSLTQGV